jgi:aspartate racemase
MSWESTLHYYRVINQEVGARLGGLHSARIVLLSVDFQKIERLQHAGEWDAAGRILASEARRVEAAGAELLVLCTNTMHKVAEHIEAAVGIPLLHIADATAEKLREARLETVGLLGTAFTMEDDFYVGRLKKHHGLRIVVPGSEDRALVHRVIYEELCRGQVREDSRREYLRVIERLARRGARGVILGCTEISLLVQPGDASVPLFDTTELHARGAVDRALEAAG